MSFPATRWSVVLGARSGDAGARAALAWLCQAYWEPLSAHARRRGLGQHSAEDLVQDLLLSLAQGEGVERADPARGRFRTWLLACLEHQLSHRRVRASAAKRGGGHAEESLDGIILDDSGDPAQGFDRAWAQALLARAQEEVRRSAGDQGRHRLLEPFLATNGDADRYAAVGKQLGLGVGAVRVAVHRLRAHFREVVRREIADTLVAPDEEDIDRELDDLLASLAGR